MIQRLKPRSRPRPVDAVAGGLRSSTRTEAGRFAVVGATGVVVNNAALFLLHGIAGLPLLVASPLAVESAIVNNYLLNDRWTFSSRSKRRGRFLKFNLVSLGGLIVNALVLNLVVAVFGLHYLVANLVGIGAAMGWNFLANATWTWPRSRDRLVRLPVVHGRTAMPDVVVVPTYDEAPNIERLVGEILRQGPFSVLVVDDGSPDGTGAIADRLAEARPGRVMVMHRATKDGLGAAYCEGFRWALAAGADRIYQMDADFSHDPSALADLRGALLGGSDMVIGSRYVPGGSVVGWPLWRQVLSRGGSTYARLLLGLAVRDLTGGYKGWTRSALQSIRIGDVRTNGYGFQIETTYRAHLAGARVGELPIVFADREVGESKMGMSIVLEAMTMVPGLRLRSPSVGRCEAHQRAA